MDSRGFLLRRRTRQRELGDVLYVSIRYGNTPDPRNGIYRWTEKEGMVLVGNPAGGVATYEIVGSYDGGVIYAINSGTIYRSVNRQPFTLVASSVIPGGARDVVCNGNGSVLYATNSSGNVYKITNLDTPSPSVSMVLATLPHFIYGTNMGRHLVCDETGNMLIYHQTVQEWEDWGDGTGEEIDVSYIRTVGISPAPPQRYDYVRFAGIVASRDLSKVYLIQQDYYNTTSVQFSNNRLNSKSLMINVANNGGYPGVACGKDGDKSFVAHAVYGTPSQFRLSKFTNGVQSGFVNVTPVPSGTHFIGVESDANNVFYFVPYGSLSIYKSEGATSPVEILHTVPSGATINGRLFANKI